MGRVVAFVVALIALVGLIHPANACENATASEFPAVKQLRRAEEALDDGDVERSRTLASEVAEGKVHLPFSMRDDLKSRATRIVALSWIRDPKAMPRDIEKATEMLRVDLAARETPDAARQADLGEAYARAGQDEAAYQMLRGLDEKDLIGSPYAYAALARVAAKRGDHGRADLARRRCSQISSNAAICQGAYPNPPLLRGNLLAYVFPGVLAIVALVRRRRKKDHPWAAFADKVFAALVVATCAFVFAFAYEPWLTTLVTFASLVVVGIGQRLAFVAAVKRGRVAGFTLREGTADDARLPVVTSFFHVGHRVLEEQPEAAYREPARVGVVRLSPRSAVARGFAIAGMLALVLLGAASTLVFATSRSASSESSAAQK
jgi:hypothetical protein